MPVMLPPIAAYIGVNASRRYPKKRKDKRPFRATERIESSLGRSKRTSRGGKEGARAQRFMSNRPRFHAEKNHKTLFQVGFLTLRRSRSVSGFRASAFPGSRRVARWKIDCPDYSGGTAPDSHRLPCYALAGS